VCRKVLMRWKSLKKYFGTKRGANWIGIGKIKSVRFFRWKCQAVMLSCAFHGTTVNSLELFNCESSKSCLCHVRHLRRRRWVNYSVGLFVYFKKYKDEILRTSCPYSIPNIDFWGFQSEKKYTNSFPALSQKRNSLIFHSHSPQVENHSLSNFIFWARLQLKSKQENDPAS
jgi:hypothetical protein